MLPIDIKLVHVRGRALAIAQPELALAASSRGDRYRDSEPELALEPEPPP